MSEAATDASPAAGADASPTTGTDAAAHETAASAADAATGIRNHLVIALLLISTFVVILNETIMGVALPRLMSGLSITALPPVPRSG